LKYFWIARSSPPQRAGYVYLHPFSEPLFLVRQHDDDPLTTTGNVIRAAAAGQAGFGRTIMLVQRFAPNISGNQNFFNIDVLL